MFRLNKTTILLGAVLVLAVTVGAVTVARFQRRLVRLDRELENRDRLVREEADHNRLILENLRQNFMVLRRDAGQVRDMLDLPALEYPPLEEPAAGIDGEGRDNTSALLFTAVETLAERRLGEEHRIAFETFLDSPELSALLEQRGFSLTLTGETAGLTREGETEFTLEMGAEGKIHIRSLSGEDRAIADITGLDTFLSVHEEANRSVLAGYADARALLENLSQNREIASAASAKGLWWGAREERPDTIFRNLEARGNRRVLVVEYDKTKQSWSVEQESASDRSVLRGLILQRIRDFDSRTPGEIAAAENRQRLDDLRTDRGFTAHLESLGLVMAPEFRDDGDYYHRDFLDRNGLSAGSVAVQKRTGEIYLMDEQGVLITSLRTLGLSGGNSIDGPEAIRPDLAGVSLPVMDKDDLAILLTGANEGNTDTIMLAHLRSDGRRGTLITLPRDLYYRGWKINGIHGWYGPEGLKKTVSEITGIPVEQYIHIDMYAFADVIDLLGGVDIVLEKPLTDPYYRVRDNGQWGTLHYPAGPVHLGGVEALRVARSRYTTNDFRRSERQQLLLLAVKDKIRDLGARDLSKLPELITILRNYADTDIPPLELFSLFRKFRNAEFRTAVLSTANVLYSSYANTYMLDKIPEGMTQAEKGAYILLPWENDWSLIPRFVSQAIGNAG